MTIGLRNNLKINAEGKIRLPTFFTLITGMIYLCLKKNKKEFGFENRVSAALKIDELFVVDLNGFISFHSFSLFLFDKFLIAHMTSILNFMIFKHHLI